MYEVSFSVFRVLVLVFLDRGDPSVGFSVLVYHREIGGELFVAVPLKISGYLAVLTFVFFISSGVVAVVSVIRTVGLATAISVFVVGSPGCFALLHVYSIDGFKVFFVDTWGHVFGILGLNW